ncbi:MAG: 4'-phosphopantetheinyl transferase superfamily protein [Thermosynechococcaceae cyanobacterium]
MLPQSQLRQQWPSASVVPELQPESVHLWRFQLVASMGIQQMLWPILSIEEQMRSQRFIRPIDQQRFVMTRGHLRWLLGQYLNMDAAAVQFTYGEKGKPMVAEVSDSGLEFNLSHSHDTALIAVRLGAALGVDLEQISPDVDYTGITKRFLTYRERQAVFNQPVSDRCQVFFKIWTRKEACIKALGGSIGEHLDQIDVSSHLEQSATSVQFTPAADTKQTFFIFDLQPAVGYAGAWATATRPSTLHQYSLDIFPDE